MKLSIRSTFALLTAVLISVACGGGGGGSNDSAATQQSITQTAKEGFDQFNLRRVSAGLPQLTFNSEIAKAAQNHSDYQRINAPFDGSPITHTETAGLPGFTGTEACPILDNRGNILEDGRMRAAGAPLDPNDGYGCGEVISAMSDSSGVRAAEELIAAIYHRFVIFQPSFREAGAGSAQSRDGRYTIFTANFAAFGSFAGIGSGNVAVYPFNGQADVPISFDHSTESPDPLPPSSFPQYVNVAVGYPVSVHADLGQVIRVNSFTLRRQSDGGALNSRLLSAGTDAETDAYSAALVPFQQLSPRTTYEANFSGTICDQYADGCATSNPISRTWSFTTR